jgi:gliding motility-associated-like protein
MSIVRSFVLLLALVVVCLELTAKELPESSGHYKFIENKGQWPNKVAFKTDIESGYIYLENNAITYDFIDGKAMQDFLSRHHNKEVINAPLPDLKAHAYRVSFLGANPACSPRGFQKLQGKYNYFHGSDPAKWAGNCEAYSGIIWENIYPGIDIVMYSNDFFLKYDIIVAPGVDPSIIQLQYEGHDGLQIENSRLIVKTSILDIIEQKPLAFQETAMGKWLPECNYQLKGDVLSFDFPDGYQKNLELTIDPELIFSTYTGSFSNNFGYTATYDALGYLYSGSSAFGTQYPIVLGSYDITFQGGLVDIALSKFDVTGTFLIYSTYLGGTVDELPHSLIVNSAGELFVYGTSSSLDFPTTADAYDQTFNGGTGLNLLNGLGVNYTNGSDIIVSRLSADGSELLASTYIGGSGNDGLNVGSPLKFNYADEIRGEIVIDEQNNIYIASSTNSNNFPVSADAFQPLNAGGGQEGCIFKMDNSLSTLIWSSYLGGSDDDAVYAIDIDNNQDIIVCGGTQSNDFPTTFGAIQTSNAGGSADGFITKISQQGSLILNSTYWGSASYDQIYFVELDNQNRVHVFGQTQASGNTFIINADYGQPSSGQFISKFNSQLSSLTWSTAFGTGNGTPNISPTAFLVDVCEKIYLSGWGSPIQGGTLGTSGLPVTPGAFQTTTTGGDFYLMVLEDDASDIFYATYFGGGSSGEHVDGGTSRFDRKGVIYQAACAGCGGNSDLPIEPNPGALSPSNNSSCNLGVFKFDFQLPITVADFIVEPAICLPAEIEIQNASIGGSSYLWDFGDDNTSTLANPTHLYTEPGVYTITLIVNNPLTCNQSDTLTQQVVVLSNSNSSLDDISICQGESEQIGVLPSTNPDITYSWSPQNFLSDPNAPNPIANPPITTTYELEVSNGVCTDTFSQTVVVNVLGLQVPQDTLLCGDEVELNLSATTLTPDATFIWSYSPEFTNPLNIDPNDPSVSITVNEATTLYIQASIDGCVETAVVNVEFTSSQTEIEGDFIACPGDTVTLSVVNPGELDYSWAPANQIISGQNTPEVEVAPSQDTWYYVESTNAEGCTVTDSVLVSVSTLDDGNIAASATPDIILEGQSSQLNALPDGYEYTWNPSNSLDDPQSQNPIASPDETTTYTVSIADGECVYTSSVTVRVFDFFCGDPDVYIPNAFTPNGDGQNEAMYVRGNFITELYFTIYDRWGEKVFETTDQNKGWDGKFKGRDCDPAVYVYYLEMTCEGGFTYFEKGNITLIR